MTARPRKTAAELMAELARNVEFREAASEREAEQQARVGALRAAEQPIVADLRKAGVEVVSVWDLVNTSEPYPSALPVLLAHLERGGYPDRVMESLGRALAVKPAVGFWQRLRVLYLGATGPGEEEGLAVALAASATPDQTDELAALLRAPTRGRTRVHFVRPLLRVGGSHGRKVVEGLRGDPVVGLEVSAALEGLSQRD